MDKERYEVLGQIVEAARIVCASEKVAKLIPEVRSNIAMSIPDPKSPEDVAAIPGRITIIEGRPAVYAYPNWAASINTAHVLMLLNSYDKSIRAVMELKQNEKLVKTLEEAGYILYEIPDAKSWKSTIEEGMSKNNAAYPIFHTKGDWLREGSTVICGADAVSVAKEVVKIAELYTKE